jgi:hypothetical protein
MFVRIADPTGRNVGQEFVGVSFAPFDVPQTCKALEEWKKSASLFKVIKLDWRLHFVQQVFEDYEIMIRNWFAETKVVRARAQGETAKLCVVASVDAHDTSEVAAELKALRSELAGLESVRDGSKSEVKARDEKVCELRDRINAIEANDNLARALIYFVPAILDEPHMRLVREAHAFS